MRILVAEDDSRLLMQLDSLFQQQGFSIDLADDGEKAIQFMHDRGVILL